MTRSVLEVFTDPVEAEARLAQLQQVPSAINPRRLLVDSLACIDRRQTPPVPAEWTRVAPANTQLHLIQFERQV